MARALLVSLFRQAMMIWFGGFVWFHEHLDVHIQDLSSAFSIPILFDDAPTLISLALAKSFSNWLRVMQLYLVLSTVQPDTF